jgi:multidrug efflux system membrane fusion protein
LPEKAAGLFCCLPYLHFHEFGEYFKQSIFKGVGVKINTTISALSAACAALVIIAACSSKDKAEKPPAPVTAATAAGKSMPVQIHAIGNVEAFQTVAVKSMVGGELVQVNFREGDFVKEGDGLFQIDARPYEAALMQAEANLARNTAQLKNASAQEKRYASLLKEKTASQELYDSAKANADAFSAAVKADQAMVENARLQLAYCTIKAPVSGPAGELKVDRGNIVKANDTSALVTINQVTPVNVSFAVAERFFADIRQHGTAAPFVVEAAAPKSSLPPARGRLSFIDNGVNTQTGTILLKATFPNEDRLLWPGQFVNVTLILAMQQNAVVVPSQAVQTGQPGTFVFVIKDDLTAELRTVTVDRTIGPETVIAKGVQAGERVVTDGHLQLVPGGKVEIKSGQ